MANGEATDIFSRGPKSRSGGEAGRWLWSGSEPCLEHVPVLATSCPPRCLTAGLLSEARLLWEFTEPYPSFCAVSLGNLIAATLKYHLYGDDSEACIPTPGSPLPVQIHISEELSDISRMSRHPLKHNMAKIRAFNLSFSAQCFPELSSARTLLLCQNLSAVFISCLLLCLHILATSKACVTLLNLS